MTAIPIREAARLAGVPRDLVHKLIAEGELFTDRGRVSEACIPMLRKRGEALHRARAVPTSPKTVEVKA